MTNNAEKCECLSHLELDEGRKVQEREENAKQKVNKFKKKTNNEEKCEYLSYLELGEGRKVQEREEKC